MSHTSLLYHCVFSTKRRKRQIDEATQPRLWSYMGGIARTNGMKALAIGGTDDHVHLLLSLPATMPIAEAMKLIKAGSSKWMHEKVGNKAFLWQEKYGAFTIGISQREVTLRYIQNQKKHHARRTSAQEWAAILKKHGLPVED
ncbi:MAG: IS200/IS605 family transposase [Candidatus Angelobacter sp.]